MLANLNSAKLLLAVTILAGSSATATIPAMSDQPAALAPAIWRGELAVTANQGCPESNVGSHVVVRFLPSGIGSNGAYSTLMAFNETGAESFRAAGRLGTVYRAAQATEIFLGARSYNLQMRFASQVPAVLTSTTPSIVATGQAKGYGGVASCVVSFTVGLQKDVP